VEKLFDAELKLMELVWEREPVSAKALSQAAAESLGWNKNTTYTVIKRLIEKNVLRREEPGFVCSSAVKRQDVQKNETNTLIERLFGGSRKAFFAAFADETLDPDEAAALRALLDRKVQP